MQLSRPCWSYLQSMKHPSFVHAATVEGSLYLRTKPYQDLEMKMIFTKQWPAHFVFELHTCMYLSRTEEKARIFIFT